MKFIGVTLLFILVALSMSAQHIPKFDLQGHRGARGIKPENTIPAFLSALEYGVTTLELDVVITKDKQVLVSHEPWMSPSICLDTAGNPFKGEKKYNIYKLTYEEVRKFDCGSIGNERFPEQLKEPANKPLLQEVIIAVENHIKNVSQYEVDYNIEIKSSLEGDKKTHPPVEEFSELVYQLIDQYLPWQRVIIQSFDFRVLKYWHTKYPKVRLAALVENLKSMEENIADLGFTPSIYSPHYTLLPKSEIKRAHALGMRVIPWTVNELKDMQEIKDSGADGLITDYPNRAAEIGLALPKRK